MPILEGLKEVHAHHYLHRDIKPGNILIRKNHSPVLIDFGASKQLVGEVSKSVTSLLTEGYAPPEQYGKDLRQQAPCTDIYAIGAVIYKMITRHVPVDAITRVNQSLTQKKDPYQKLTDLRPPGYDFHFLKAVDRALALDCNDRPRDVSEFQKELLHPSGSSGRADTPKEERPPRKRTRDPRPEKERKRFPLTLILLLLAGGGIGLYLSLHPTLLNQRETPPPSHPSAKARERSTQHTRTPVVTFSETPKASRGEHVRETRSSVSDTSAADTEEKRCARGDRLACYRLGRAYFQGSDGKLVDYRQAKKFLTRACRQREYRACALLGELHEKGLGTPRDYSLAFSLYDQACDHGVGQGCDGEGYLYFRGEGVRKDLKKAFESYRRSCEELNYEKACVNLGYMYEHGYGVEEDPSKAYLLYYRACRQGGIVGGCVNLGVLKEKLAKTKEDYLKAFRLYREACEKGNGRGCTNMALLYRDGKGVAKDPAKARELLTRACKDLLDPLACRRLNAMEQ
jgi:TPR repeat protein